MRDDTRKEFVDGAELEALAGDASGRKYFRVKGKGQLVMDDEGCRCKPKEFMALSKFLRSKGVHVPEVYKADFENGLFLIEDLGDNSLAKLLICGDEQELYKLATQALIKVVSIEQRPDNCLDLTKERLIGDICFFADWYFPMATGYSLSADKRREFVNIIGKKADLAYKVPGRLLLWDYHVDNIMLPDGGKECAIIDFQDAMWGPLTYDIMSLLEDARRDVSEPVQTEMKNLFFSSLSGVGRKNFDDSYAFLSMFRHMRVLGRFTILMATVGKDRYLQFVPHLWQMLERTLEYPELIEIKNWLDANFPKKLRVIPKRKPIKKAILLAAGRGSRMKELTSDMPKPLIKVAGKAMIDYNFERLKASGITDVVVNLCYKGEMIKEHIEKNQPDFKVIYSWEKEALETGGGIKRALSLLQDEVFFAVNTDVFTMFDEIKPALWKMADLWDDKKYDIILLLETLENTIGDNDNGVGNYKIDDDGRPVRNVNKTDGFPYMFAGVSLLHRRIFANETRDKFSLRDQFDEAEKNGRLGYVVNNGAFFHVGTPQALAIANAKINGDWQKRC